MKRLLLLRHGVTAANEQRRYCGATDLPLSPAGRQALLALRETGKYPDISGLLVYTSGLKRTEETLAALYGPVAHEAIPDLAEMDFGAFEMHTYEELKEQAAYQTWLTGDNDANLCPGGESGKRMEARVLAALARLQTGSDVLLVSHGGPIAAIMASLFPSAGKNRYEWQPRNGCGYDVLVSDHGAGESWRSIPDVDII